MLSRVHKWTPKHVTMLRQSLLAETQSGDYAGLALACLVALRPKQGEAVCADKAAKLAGMLRSVASMRVLGKRIDERLRRRGATTTTDAQVAKGEAMS